MRTLTSRLLAVSLLVLLLVGCQGDAPAGPPSPYGLDDVVTVLQDAGFEVSGGDALGPEETGQATLQAGDVTFGVAVHVDEDAARDDGGRRYGNLTFSDLDDGLQDDAAVISAIAAGLSSS